MNGTLDDALAAITADVRVVVPGEVALASGERFRIGANGVATAGLTELLYARHYCRSGQPPGRGSGSNEAFLSTLRLANPVRVRAGADHEMVTEGHYFVLGRAVIAAASGRQVRFYWNVEGEGAAALLAALGRGLERRRIPFQLKVPIAPSGYDRTDAGVLYAAAEDVAALWDVVAETHGELGGHLRDDVPLLARRLARGLGFAESPQSGESFGLQRCRLLAEGLVAAQAERSDPVAAMRARLAGYGLEADAPERNPGTRFPYIFDTVAR